VCCLYGRIIGGVCEYVGSAFRVQWPLVDSPDGSRPNADNHLNEMTLRKPPWLAESPSSTPGVLLSMRAVKDDQDDEGQKGRQLEQKEGKSHRHECVGLYMAHVNRRLYDSGGENRD
jgi:hypothetical protein